MSPAAPVPVDPQLAIQLLHEHKREAVGPRPAFGEPRKQGRRPRVATDAEVEAALLKSPKAFEDRVKVRISAADQDPPRPTSVPRMRFL